MGRGGQEGLGSRVQDLECLTGDLGSLFEGLGHQLVHGEAIGGSRAGSSQTFGDERGGDVHGRRGGDISSYVARKDCLQADGDERIACISSQNRLEDM